MFLLNVSGGLFTNLFFYSNTAYSGGAVALSNCWNNRLSFDAVSNNGAQGGGGIAIVANWVGPPSTNNTVSGLMWNNYGSYGGGVYMFSADQNTIACRMASNNASYGGGFATAQGSPIVSNAISGDVVYNNSSTNGGGMYISMNDCLIASKVFGNRNGGGFGGGVYLYTGTNNSFTGDFIQNTNTSMNGGGLYCQFSSMITVTGNFISNYANAAGGGLFFTNTRNTFTGNAIANGAGGNGGGLYSAGYYTLISANFYSNTAPTGSGLLVNGWSNTVTGTFAYNYSGSAIRLVGDSNALSVTMTTNAGTTAPGGAIYASGSSNVFSGIWVSNAAASVGGAISFTGSSYNTITGTFLNNYAPTYGGAVEFSSPGFYNTVSATMNNNRTLANGGALHIGGVHNGSFNINASGNSTAGSGGVVYLNGCTSNLVTGTFLNNTATGAGGAVYGRRPTAISLRPTCSAMPRGIKAAAFFFPILFPIWSRVRFTVTTPRAREEAFTISEASPTRSLPPWHSTRRVLVGAPYTFATAPIFF